MFSQMVQRQTAMLARAVPLELEATGRSTMWRSSVLAASGLAIMLLGAARADAAGVGIAKPPSHAGSMLQHVHSVYEAEQTLYRRGSYDVRLERASLPYSFNACKRGIRYHIHVDYYGELVEVDEVGSCRRYDDDQTYYGRRPYYDRYRDYRRRDY
jgi:hypothetical protein